MFPLGSGNSDQTEADLMVLGFGSGAVLNFPPLQFAALFQFVDLAVGGLGEAGAAFVHVGSEDLVELLEAAGLEAVNGRELNSGAVGIFVHTLLLELDKLVGGGVVEAGDGSRDLGEVHVEAGVAPVLTLGHGVFENPPRSESERNQ